MSTYLLVKDGAESVDLSPQAGSVSMAEIVRAQLAAPAPASGCLRHRVVTLTDVDPHVALWHAPKAATATYFRTIAAALHLRAKETPRLLVTSAAPGDGKSTCCVNLAFALAERCRVALVDLHFARPRVGQMLGISGPGLAEALVGRRRDAGAPTDLYRVRDGLLVLPGTDFGLGGQALARVELPRLLNDLAAVVDVLLIDGPPALGAAFSALRPMVDAAVLVSRPGQEGSGVQAAARKALGGMPIASALTNRM